MIKLLNSAFLLALITPLVLFAQTYEPIGEGSRFKCGYFGDGTNKIFEVKKNNNFIRITYKKASKEVAGNLNVIRNRLKTMRGIANEYAASREVSKKKLNELKKNIKNYLGTDVKVESAAPISEREILVRRLISKLESEEGKKVAELEGLKKCDTNERPAKGVVSFTTQPMYFDLPHNRVFGVMIFTSAASGEKNVLDYPQRWFCIRSGIADAKGQTVLFTGNPCYAFGQGDEDCSELVPKGKLANFRSTVWDTYSSDGDPAAKAERIAGRLAEAEAAYPSVTGRIRGKTGSYFEDEVQQDDCSQF